MSQLVVSSEFPGGVPDLQFDLRVLAKYLVVCKTLRMGAAAQRLQVSTPAISQLIHKIEKHLGVDLFERTPTGLRLTPAGAVLRERAQALIDIEAEVRRELSSYSGRMVPTLRLYMLDSVAINLLNAILTKLTAASRTVEILSGRSLTYIRDFMKGEIDVLVSGHAFEDIPALENHQLCRQDFVAVAPASLSEKDRTLERLAGTLPLIRFRKATRIDGLVDEYLARHGLQLPRTIECSCPATTLRLVAGGHGWTIGTPLSICWFRDLWKDFAWIALPPPVVAEKLYLSAPAEKFLDVPAVLADQCREAIRAEVRSWRGTPAAVFTDAVTVAA